MESVILIEPSRLDEPSDKFPEGRYFPNSFGEISSNSVEIRDFYQI